MIYTVLRVLNCIIANYAPHIGVGTGGGGGGGAGAMGTPPAQISLG